MAEESITIGKDAIYSIVIVLLAGLLVVSIFTQGFGIVKAECPDGVNATECPETPQADTNSGENNTETSEPELPQLTVEFGSYPPLGDESAPVAMVEFTEFQCPYCARHYSQTEAQLKINYIDSGKLKLYFRDYPLPPQYHPQAGIAAIAGRCANDQGKFWEMHDKLFDTRELWSGNSEADSLFKEYAIELGLDNETFSSCYDNQSHAEEIVADLEAGQSYGVGGTPASFLIIPKSKVDAQSFESACDSLNEEYKYQDSYTGEWVYPFVLHEDANDYTILVSGAYPYTVFDAFLSEVNY